jgi:hypothetical protein
MSRLTLPSERNERQLHGLLRHTFQDHQILVENGSLGGATNGFFWTGEAGKAAKES